MEFRFSTMISVLYVVFSYSAISPILYPIAFLVFFFLYWSDKVLLLNNTYLRPAQFEAELVR